MKTVIGNDELAGELALLLSESVTRLRPLLGNERISNAFNDVLSDNRTIDAGTVTKMPAWHLLQGVKSYAVDRVASSRSILASLRRDIQALETLLALSITSAQLLTWKREEVREAMRAEASDQTSDSNIATHGRYRGAVKELIELAKSHLAMDMDSRLTLPDVARLTKLKESSVMSAAQRRLFSTEETNGRRTAAPSDVLAWVLDRGFQPTRFEDELTYQQEITAMTRKDKTIWIPIASDGSRFLPSCRRANGYEIGPKDNEQYVETYEAALEKLQKDWEEAHWRRPNVNGNWGVVSAVRWEKVLFPI